MTTRPYVHPQRDYIAVVITDPIPEACQSLSKLLARISDDIKVIGTGSTGQEAVEFAKDLCPDVMLIYFSYSNMEGLTAIELITRLMPSIGVIAMSFDHEEDILKRALLAGACDFLFLQGRSSAETILEIIRNAYGRVKTRREAAMRTS